MPNPSPDTTVELDRTAVGFARVLRGLGLAVTTDHAITFVEALAATGIAERSLVYCAGRATLVGSPEDLDLYDRAFAVFWDGADDRDDDVAHRPPPLAVATDDDLADDAAAAGERMRAVRWSPAEVLRERDFAAYSPAEFDEAKRVLRDLRLARVVRRSRRRRPVRRTRGRNPQLDVRRTVKRSFPSGELVDRAFRAAGAKPRPVVLLCDISGSMEPYARVMVRFLHAAVAAGGPVEAFAFGTRLTRITKELSSHDPDRALQAAAEAVLDWSGGTRLGASLREFNDRWGVRGVARGAVVVILSDGWDRGDPAQLGEQMARLHRVTYRIIWVNPLKAGAGFAPLASGMAAALPHVDDFLEGHSLASLEELAAVVGRERTRR